MKAACAEIQRAVSGVSTLDANNEKDVHHHTKPTSSGDTTPDGLEPQGYDAKATKRLLRKRDWHIIPFMSLIYLCVLPSLLLYRAYYLDYVKTWITQRLSRSH